MTATNKPTAVFWIIGILALVWNLMGTGAFFYDMTISPEALAEFSEGKRMLYKNNPIWLKALYGIATIGGALACIGLLMRKTWCIPIFGISLLAVVIQMGYGILVNKTHESLGTFEGMVLPMAVIVVAFLLYWYSKRLRSQAMLT